MDTIDLHIHSTYSDGTLSPVDLVERARTLGLQAIAITDHDTVAGVPEAIASGIRTGIKVIAGIEISAWHRNRSLHILGYGLHHDHPILLAGLKDIQRARKARNMAILDKLNRHGIKIDHNELADLAHDQIGRPHIAQLLIRKGIVRGQDEAFARFLRKGAKAYVARKKFEAILAIKMIREAGGIAVLAHPGSLDPSLRSLPAILQSLQPAGLAGIEVYYPSHSASTITNLRNMAKQRGLLQSGGTDFHGAPAWEELLTRLTSNFTGPQDCLAQLEEHITKQSNLSQENRQA